MAFRRLYTGIKSLGSTRLSWSLIDQGTISFGNFATFIILGNILPTVEFGIYALLFGVMQIVNSMQGGLIEYPMTLRISRKERDKHGVVGCALVYSWLWVIPWLGVLYGASVYLKADTLFAYSAGAMIFWQAQNLMRRSLVAEQKFRHMAVSDSVSYLGQAALVFALSWLGNLSLETALLAMAVSSAASLCVQLWQVRPDFRQLRMMGDFIVHSWSVGIWAALTGLVGAFMMHSPGWVLAEFHGPEATAALRALVTVCGVTHPLTSSIQSMLVASVARASNHGMERVLDTVMRMAVITMGLVLPFLLVIALFPETVLGVFYPKNPDFVALGFALQLFACIYVLRNCNMLMTGTLNGLAHSKQTFLARLTSLSATLGIHLPMAAKGGVIFAIIGSIMTNLVLSLLLATLLLRMLRQRGVTTAALLQVPGRTLRGELRRFKRRFAGG